MTRRNLVISLAAASASARAGAQNPPEQPQQQKQSKLQLVDVTVGEFSTSMMLPNNFAFVSGIPVYVSFRVAGFAVEPELSLVHLEYSVEFLDGIGNPFDVPVTGRFARRISLEEGAPLPLIRVKATIPDYIYPADARFRIKLTDKRTKETTTSEGTIPVRSELPKLSGNFEALGLRVFRSETDESPVTDAVFRPGDSIWVRFLLAGFQWKEHEYDLRYGISVLGMDGRVILSAPEAAAERNSSNYLRAYVPAVAAIRLERTARPGPCKLVINAIDNLAKAEVKVTSSFQIASVK